MKGLSPGEPWQSWHQRVRQAEELRFQDPGRSLEASLAVRDQVASLGGEGKNWVFLQADAWSALGSVYRSVGELSRAEGCLQVALAFLDDLGPSVTPGIWARFAQRASYLRCSQRRFDEALDLNIDVVQLYMRDGMEADARAAGVDKALFLARSGRPREAISVLDLCLDEIDRKQNPMAFLAAVHNMTYYRLLVAENIREEEEALVWLDQARDLHREHPELLEPLGVLQLQAIAGATAIRMGRNSAGEEALRNAYEGFLECRALPEQMLTLLYLSHAALHRDDEAEILRLAGLIFPLLKTVSLPSVARNAVLRFLGAARSGKVTVDLIHRVADELHQAMVV